MAGPGLERLGQRHQGRLGLAPEHGVDPLGEEVLPVELGVEPVRHDVARGIDGPDRSITWRPTRSALRIGPTRRRAGPRRPLGIEGLHRDVHDRRHVAARLQERRRPGDAERLMAQLVAGHQEDLAGLSHPALHSTASTGADAA